MKKTMRGRLSKIDKMSDAELGKEFSQEQLNFLELVRRGRKDPVFFAEFLFHCGDYNLLAFFCYAFAYAKLFW